MTHQHDELFSALVDDEFDSRQNELLLRRISRDDELKQRWQRYHLIGDALRGQLAEHHDRDFAQGVMARIASESIVLDNDHDAATTTKTAWRRPALGFALAASLATCAVVFFGLGSQQGDGPMPMVSGSAPATNEVSSSSGLEAYLAEHSRYATLGGAGMLPYMRLVGSRAEQR